MNSFIGRQVAYFVEGARYTGVVAAVNVTTNQVKVRDSVDGDVWQGDESKVVFL